MPAKKNQDVMEMVRDQLTENPDIETDALFDKAKEIDSSLEDLSLRQFHARYPLQVKRQLSSKKKKKAKKAAGSGSKAKGGAASKGGDATGASPSGGREVIRDGLLRFAKDVAAAESKADLITVLTSVDDYVDDVAADLEKA